MRSVAITLVVAAACDAPAASAPDAPVTGWVAAATLPEPLANNAVAAVAEVGGCALYTAYGIDATRLATGIHTRAYRLAPGATSWTPLPELPAPGRLAASAVALRGRLHVLGGYSVAPDGTETSHAELLRYAPGGGGAWEALATPSQSNFLWGSAITRRFQSDRVRVRIRPSWVDGDSRVDWAVLTLTFSDMDEMLEVLAPFYEEEAAPRGPAKPTQPVWITRAATAWRRDQHTTARARVHAGCGPR